MRLRYARKRLGPVFALALLLGLLVVGSAFSQRSALAPTVTIEGTPKFTGSWREGWFAVWQTRVVRHRGQSDYVWKRVRKGSLNVVGTVSEAAQLKVMLRSSSGKVISTSKPFSRPAGRYAASLKLGRPLPGSYTVTTRVVGPSDTTLNLVHKQVTFAPPPEGVPDRASISSSETGMSVKVLRNRHEAWARFHFLTPPRNTRTVYIEWRRPDWVHVCQKPNGPVANCKLKKKISANGSVSTFLRSPKAPLDVGRWYCQMTVKHGGRYIVARRTFVTIR
jgi:hypothetical protein